MKILGVLVFLSFFYIGCAGSGSQSSSGAGASGVSAGSGEPASPALDSIKNELEASEFEAHRLREQIYRKKQSQ